jgi:arylsulfatase A-like enzyme
MPYYTCILVATISMSARYATQCRAAESPCVLFSANDDLNDWVGCLDGHPQAHTPNIDRLAKRGVLFTSAHCASPACNPSRAAVFSGKMPWKTGVWSNKSKKLLQQHPDMLALPRAFSRAGYVTLGTGKLMHSGASANRVMFDQHFDVEQRWSPFTKKAVQYTKDELPSKGGNEPHHVARLEGVGRVVLPLNRMPSDRNPNKADGESFDWGSLDVPDSAMGDKQITDWAIAKLKTSFDKPTFLGVGYYRPHIPLFAPSSYFKRFKGRDIQLPPYAPKDHDDLSQTGKRWAIEADTAGLHATVAKHKQWEPAVKAYLACTTFVDTQVGRLLDALDSGDLGDNTIIVLWSDHGWHLGEKQHWGKWTGWERSTRVPLIVVLPKRLAGQFAKPGSRCDSPVSLIDLYPTLAELCSLKTPDGLDGESLVPLLRRPTRKSSRTVITSFDPGNVSVRDGQWRLIRYADGGRELYDLKNDPNEWTNLADDHKYDKRVRELSKAIPAQALPRDQQAEFERLKSRVRRFNAKEIYAPSTPILFKTNFSSGSLNLLAISEDDHYSIARPDAKRLIVVNAPADREGAKAVRFSVPYKDGAFRSELSLVHEQGFQQRWYAARVFIPKDWPDELGPGNDIVMQWHAIPGNWRATYPNMSLSVRNGEWHLRRSFGSAQTKPTRQSAQLGKVFKGRWTQWVFHVKWSPKDDGRIRVWKDGQPVFDQTAPNVYGTIGVEYTPYLKFGIYHPSWKNIAGVSVASKVKHRTVYITDIVVGDERADLKTVDSAFSSTVKPIRE